VRVTDFAIRQVHIEVKGVVVSPQDDTVVGITFSAIEDESSSLYIMALSSTEFNKDVRYVLMSDLHHSITRTMIMSLDTLKSISDILCQMPIKIPTTAIYQWATPRSIHVSDRALGARSDVNDLTHTYKIDNIKFDSTSFMSVKSSRTNNNSGDTTRGVDNSHTHHDATADSLDGSASNNNNIGHMSDEELRARVNLITLVSMATSSQTPSYTVNELLPTLGISHALANVITDTRIGIYTMTICSTINPDLYIHISWGVNGSNIKVDDAIMNKSVSIIRNMIDDNK